MRYDSLTQMLATDAPSKGPLACLFIEDDVEIGSTLRHHLACGFERIIVFARAGFTLPALSDDICHVVCDTPSQPHDVLPPLIDACAGMWIYYGFNAEYLFYPFSDNRTVGELTTFVTEERRDVVLCFTVDLYARDLDQGAVSLESACLDRTGYYALARQDADGRHLDRQMDFHGGLRWRFEEHIPEARRRIDRTALFRAKKGLRLRADHTLSDPEMNTVSCPWHHSPTASICSFRAAKALLRNPGSRFDVQTFEWANSVPFQWHPQQLLDYGLMEPGQWF